MKQMSTNEIKNMEKIKLVIWDLDETFWKGTLSEGEITFIPENIEMVKELTNRGIVNSISSKNDYEQVKLKLIEAGIWDYFIFPSINWFPKGPNVKDIIINCQLRAPNILFIDDNVTNRKEVEHYNEGINTISELQISQILFMPELKGKDDSTHSRLKQYKILEKKFEAKSSYSDNEAFLRDSKIKIKFIRDVKPYKERIFELINRTNQLNFTKVRLEIEQLEELLNDNEVENVCLHVQDRFGDYGICGFYSLDIPNRRLRHFLFSCRILNLGIETYVYQKLSSPQLQIVQPVAGCLSSGGNIDWIEEVDTLDLAEKSEEPNEKVKILMLGGCDLEQMCHYVDGNKFDIIKEFNYPNKHGATVHKEHTCYLKAMRNCSFEEKTKIENLAIGDPKMFNSVLYTEEYDVLVYSVLMNYTQEMFKDQFGGYCVAYGGYQTEEDAYANLPMREEEVTDFQSHYSYIGQQKPEDFKNDLEWLYETINKPIIFINGAEVPDFNKDEVGACYRHRQMNKVMDEFVRNHRDRCQLIDIRNYVKKREDCKDNIRHYQRPVYIKMAEVLMNLVYGNDIKVKKSTIVKQRILSIAKIVYHKLKG